MVGTEQQQALDFATERKVTYPLIFDEFGRSLIGLNGYPRNVVPSTILLDRQHRVAAVYLRPIRIKPTPPPSSQKTHPRVGDFPGVASRASRNGQDPDAPQDPSAGGGVDRELR